MELEINDLSEWSCGWRETLQRECQDQNHRKKAAFRSIETLLTSPIRRTMLGKAPHLFIAAEFQPQALEHFFFSSNFKAFSN